MIFFLSIQIGLREILAHKFRSFLTMVGIILGVASLVAMFATVEGMARGMRENLMIWGGVGKVSVTAQEVPAGQEDLKELSTGLVMEDAIAIRRECPLVAAVSPWVSLPGPTVQCLNKTTRPGSVLGVMPVQLAFNNFEIESGRFISDLDLAAYARVCVIGWPVWDGLEQSMSDSPIGTTLKINDIPFRVVGVFRDYETTSYRRLRQSGKIEAWEKRAKERRGSAGAVKGKSSRNWNSSWWKNNRVVIPLTTMQIIFRSAVRELPNGDKEPDRRLSQLDFEPGNVAVLNEAINQVKSVLLKQHRGVEDFGFNTSEDWIERIESSVRGARFSGGIIAGISLLVGGIGIANIMLASITERVREIGIRLAVGARQRDIFFQVLIESSVLGALGGLLGLGASFGIVELIKQIPDLTYDPAIRFDSLLISFGFSVLTGILAGIYPALRASRLDPIQALRYE